MRVEVAKITNIDLMQEACAFTINKESKMTLDKIYMTEHSPLRTQMFTVKMYDIPTFVSVHLVRHKIGVEHFVKSNREDRPGFSGDLGREQPVNHMMFLNAQALIQMSLKRLCSTTHANTKEVVEMIRDGVELIDPDLAKYMVPQCIYRGGICQELRCCGFNKTYKEAE